MYESLNLIKVMACTNSTQPPPPPLPSPPLPPHLKKSKGELKLVYDESGCNINGRGGHLRSMDTFLVSTLKVNLDSFILLLVIYRLNLIATLRIIN